MHQQRRHFCFWGYKGYKDNLDKRKLKDSTSLRCGRGRRWHTQILQFSKEMNEEDEEEKSWMLCLLFVGVHKNCGWLEKLCRSYKHCAVLFICSISIETNTTAKTFSACFFKSIYQRKIKKSTKKSNLSIFLPNRTLEGSLVFSDAVVNAKKSWTFNSPALLCSCQLQ